MEMNMLIILQDKDFGYVYMKFLVSSEFLFLIVFCFVKNMNEKKRRMRSYVI